MFSRSQSELEIFAKRASDAYLQSGISPSDTVIKVSRDNNLSPEQIKRVCEFANHNINEHLLKCAQSRTFEFPLADAQHVLEILNTDTQISVDDQDYMRPPKVASHTPTTICARDNKAPENTFNKKAVKYETLFKLRELYRNAEHIKTAAIRKAADIREEMYGMITKMVDSGYKLEDLYTAAKTASRQKDTVRDVFKYITARLKDEGKLDQAIKISASQIEKLNDKDNKASSEEARFPVGRHWVRKEILPGTMEANLVKLEESISDVAKSEVAMGHISSMLDTVKTVSVE